MGFGMAPETQEALETRKVAYMLLVSVLVIYLLLIEINANVLMFLPNNNLFVPISIECVLKLKVVNVTCSNLG